jgi:hypothetical protein
MVFVKHQIYQNNQSLMWEGALVEIRELIYL